MPSTSFNFKALNEMQLIERRQKSWQVSSIANTVIKKHCIIIMKYMDIMLERGSSLMDDRLAPAPVSAPASTSARVSAPAFRYANKRFASIVKTMQPIIVEPTDDVVVASKEEMMNRANEALTKVNVRNGRVTNKGTLIVKVSSLNSTGS